MGRRAGSARPAKRSASGVKQLGGVKQTRGRTFFMVGGSWRALARIDMVDTDYPLPITHEYRMAPKRARELRRIVSQPDPRWSKAAAAARLASAPVAAMLLDVLADELEPGDLVVSTFGIREGLLFSNLGPRTRVRDPLIEAARQAGGGEHRFGQHGDLLDQWISPLFDDSPEMSRLRRASCLLADVAWQANPGFRADRGIEMALHGNWVAITAAGRVIMAQALTSNFGREKLPEIQARAIVQRSRAPPRPPVGPRDAPRPAAVGRRRLGPRAHRPQRRRRGGASPRPPIRAGFGWGAGQAAARTAGRIARPQNRGRSRDLAGVAFGHASG